MRGYRRWWLAAWAALSLVWVAAMATGAIRSWPRLPLDVAGGDPQVTAAYDRAVTRHAVNWGLLAAGPPLVLLVLMAAAARRARRDEA